MKYYRIAAFSLSLLSALAAQAASADQFSTLGTMQPASADPFLPPGKILGPVSVHSLQLQDITMDDPQDITTILQVFHAYVYYHDTHNGQALASLFTPDGIFEDLYNNSANGTLEPTKGVGGLGCTMVGRAQIAQYIIVSGGTLLAFPGHSHHMPTSEVVTIGRDRQTATLTANFQVASTNDTTGAVGASLTADYIVDFVRFGDIWEISRILPINDSAGVSSSCSMNGPIPPVP
jgi:SnoaL-like domain